MNRSELPPQLTGHQPAHTMNTDPTGAIRRRRPIPAGYRQPMLSNVVAANGGLVGIGGPWSGPCPGHAHPLETRVFDGVAVWECPISSEHYRQANRRIDALIAWEIGSGTDFLERSGNGRAARRIQLGVGVHGGSGDASRG